MDVIEILIGAGLTALCTLSLGALALRRLDLQGTVDGRLERAFFQFTTGAALLSLAVFLLCVAGLATRAAFLGIGALCALSLLLRGRGRASRNEGARESASPWLYLFAPLALLFGGLYCIHGLAPATSPDGVTYHLGLVRQYLNHAGFWPLPASIYAYLSQGAEMLYLFAYAFGAHSAAKLVHLLFTGAVVAGLLAFGRRFETGFQGTVAAGLFLCSPIVGVVAPTAYNDLALVAFWFAAFYALALWLERPEFGWLALVGLAGGSCFAVKYTGFLALPAATAAIVWTSRRRNGWSAALRNATIVCGIAAVFMAPWLLKNAFSIGNPVAPFFNEWFPNGGVTPLWEEIYTRNMRHYNGFGLEGWQAYVTAPLELTLWGGKVQGIAGPVFLLAPVVFLAWRRPLARLILAAAALAAAPWLENAGARFILPGLPFAALGIEMGLSELRAPLRSAAAVVVLLVHGFSSWPAFIPRWHEEWVWKLDETAPWRAALRLEPEDAYLAARVDGYSTVRAIDELPPDGRVLTLMHLPEAYADTPIMVSYQGAFNERMMRAVDTSALPELQPSRRTSYRLAPAPYSGIRVRQVGDEPYVAWRVAEIELFDGARRLEPAKEWRVSTPRSPWPALFLIDANPASIWESGQSLHSDMRIAIRFPEPVALDRIEVTHPPQAEPRLALEVQDEPSGPWRPLEAKPSEESREPSSSDLKRWAGQELRSHGIGVLATNMGPDDANRTAVEIDRDPAAFGLEEVFRDGAWRLYRVK